MEESSSYISLKTFPSELAHSLFGFFKTLHPQNLLYLLVHARLKMFSPILLLFLSSWMMWNGVIL